MSSTASKKIKVTVTKENFFSLVFCYTEKKIVCLDNHLYENYSCAGDRCTLCNGVVWGGSDGFHEPIFQRKYVIKQKYKKFVENGDYEQTD